MSNDLDQQWWANTVKTSENSEMKAIDAPRLVLSSCLRDLGNDLYQAFVTESFSSQYDRIAEEIISKLSQSGIQIIAKEDRNDPPKNQKPVETTSKDQ